MKPVPKPNNLVTAFDAKTRFGDLLDRAAKGEVIVITRHGHPVARLGPFDETIDRARARAAAERLMKFGEDERIRLPKNVTVRDLINEGRE
jgi:prevent-host-death family protein